MTDANNFVDLLRKNSEYNVVGHVRPDGDCVGSQLAMVNILKHFGIKCNIVKNCDYGHVLSKFFDGYETTHDIDASLPLICVDCADFGRTGEMVTSMYGATRPYISIDHHASNTTFADNNFVDPSAASTTENIANIMLQSGIPFSKAISNMLYLGMMTDTNRFAYNNTTENTINIFNILVKNGADISSMYYSVYERNRIERYRLLEIFFKNIHVFADGKCCLSYITSHDIENVGAKHGDTEGFVDYTRQLDGVIVGAFLTFFDDSVRCSIRSRSPDLRVDLFAKKFGGLGHYAAAGATVVNPPSNFLETFEHALADHVSGFLRKQL